MTTLISVLLGRRHLLAILTLLLGAAVAWGMQFTTLDATFQSILSEDDPYREEVDQARLDFPPATSVLFAFQHAESVFRPEVLAAMEALTERYTEVDSAISVGSLLNYRLSDTEAERLGRDYLFPELSAIAASDLPALKAMALADEDLTKRLLAPEGDMALAVIKYKANDDEQSTRLQIARSVMALRDALRSAYPGVEIYVLGSVLFELEGHNAQIKDTRVLAPLVFLISIALLWFCLRSLAFALCLFAVALATIALAIGSFGWLGVPLNQISRLGPLVVLVIAIADGIHIISVYVQGLHQSMSKLAAMRESLRVNLQPVTLATITTAMGFLSLNYCSSPGIYGFGNIVAIGVCWAFLVTLTLLPALILLVPVRAIPKPLGVSGFITLVQGWVARKGSLLFWCSTVLILFTLALLPLNKLDFNRYSFIDEESDFHHVLTALAEKIGNDQSLVYSVHSGEYYGITAPEFLLQVDRFSQWLESQPEASFVTSYTDYLRARGKEADEDADGGPPPAERLPTDQLEVIDYLVGYQLVQEIEPSLEPIFNSDYSAIRLIVGTSNLSNGELVAFNDRIDAWVDAQVDQAYRVMHGDNSILFARQDLSITRELIEGFSLSFVLITLTLIIGLRSLRYGLISIIPNLFPATIVFGFWGLFVGELSPYILMLFSISIGLVVDDSVHILSKYISARREGAEPEAAVTYSLDRAGSAITITTLSLAAGTFILVLSNTPHFQNLALMLTPIIIVALLLDLLFLPQVLVRFDRWQSQRAERRALSQAA